MRVTRYRGKHLRPKPKNRLPVALGTAAAMWMTAPAARASTHVVSTGETLSGIAARYGTSASRLAAVNDLDDPDLITVGMRLRIPARLTFTSVHVVAEGETLSHVAARYGTSVATLARVNRLRDPNLVVAGSSLRVPGGALPAPTVSVSTPTDSPSSESIGSMLERHALAHGVDADLVKAVAWQESGWSQTAVSSVGAIGVMQVMPDTARFVNDVLGGGGLDYRVADDNIHIGVMYLRHLLDSMPTRDAALAAYYAGPKAVGSRLDPNQRAYAAAVVSHRGRF